MNCTHTNPCSDRDPETCNNTKCCGHKDSLPAWFYEIQAESIKATRKFPTWPTDPIHAAGVVAEECGELQKAVNEAVYEAHKGSLPNIRTEAIQTAAMCIRFIASLDKYEYTPAKQHHQTGA